MLQLLRARTPPPAETPVIMLTARGNGDATRWWAWIPGADDYRGQALRRDGAGLSRVKAVLRRSPEQEAGPGALTAPANVTLDPSRRTASPWTGRSITLTRKEFDLL